MKTRISLFLSLLLITYLPSGFAEELDVATQSRISKAEAGPSAIDVSGYPKGAQDDYTVFSQKCSQCHKISRAINSDYAIPDEWERYIKRMMHKPGSGIDKTDAKKIFNFLVYDSSVRKKVLYEQKLSQLPPDEKTAAEDKVKEISEAYGGK